MASYPWRQGPSDGGGHSGRGGQHGGSNRKQKKGRGGGKGQGQGRESIMQAPPPHVNPPKQLAKKRQREELVPSEFRSQRYANGNKRQREDGFGYGGAQRHEDGYGQGRKGTLELVDLTSDEEETEEEEEGERPSLVLPDHRVRYGPGDNGHGIGDAQYSQAGDYFYDDGTYPQLAGHSSDFLERDGYHDIQQRHDRPTPVGLRQPMDNELHNEQQRTAAESNSAAISELAADVVPINEPTLCPEQQDLVKLILDGHNVFYTGSAGCGKSTVLKAFVKRLEAQGKQVKIVAPTGRAALDVNGSTTWTFAGWTPDSHKKSLDELRANAHRKIVWKRLVDTDVLVVDEISMVENLHFERLNEVMKEARADRRAFGGVQVVVTGDFCQLPPVKPFGHCIECGRELIKNKEETEYKCSKHGIYYDVDKWAFRSKAWEECNFKHVNLTTIHRQNDKVFIDILNKLRLGIRLEQPSIDLLLNHECSVRNAVKLFATREEVKRVNDRMFGRLPTKPRPYVCLDNFQGREQHPSLKFKGDRGPDGTILALRDHRYDSHIQLKKGMLVVLLHNLDLNAGLVNGSQGTIQGFELYSPAKMPATASNSNANSLAPGRPSLQGDHAPYREGQIRQYAEKMEIKEWPIVQFLNGVKRTIFPDCTVNELGDAEPKCLLSRTQMPLMAAWAMTTHKSQGMTLNRVIVDLSRSFEQGQAYVALSRARSLDGLKVESFPRSAQGEGNAQVREFLREKFGLEVG